MDKQSQEVKVSAKRAKAQKMDALISNAKLFGAGIAVGVVATLIVGFSTDSLVTPSNAERMARDAANEAEIAAVLPYCIANFRASPNLEKNLAALQKTSSWMRDQFIGEGKWANTPDGEGVSSSVLSACAEKLVADDKAAKKAAADAKELPAKGT
jgi:hypothetical protein